MKSIIRNLNDGDDLQSTISVLKACGAKIDRINKTIEVEGVDLISPNKELDCGNSGTTARLLIGLLSTNPDIQVKIKGDNSLNKRNMRELID